VIINPFGVHLDIPGYGDLKSCGFNPLARLDPKAASFNREAAQLADALITVESKDPHWSTSARALLAALIMFTVIEARKSGQTPTMARVRELLCEASAAPHAGNEFKGLGIPKRALEMMESSIAGLRNKASQFTDWNREIQGIASTAKIQTEPFDDDELTEDLGKDGFDFRELKKQPTTVYLILPPDAMERHSKWLRLVITSAIQAVLRVRKPGEPKVLFMLDEFFALGHLEIISTVWALVRGYGVQMMPVLQDLPQLKKLYPDMWETFVGMAGAVLSFAANDLTTAEWLSRRAGETTIETESYNSSSNSGSSSGAYNPAHYTTSQGRSSGYSRSPTKTALMTPHKFLGLPPGFAMLTLDGLADMVPVYAPAYYDIRQCWLVARDNPYYQGG
jgi:type IV secretion system protein VirD4